MRARGGGKAAAWAAAVVLLFFDGVGEGFGGLVLPDLAVIGYAGYDACAGAGKGSKACDDAIAAVTSTGVTVQMAASILNLLCNPIVGRAADRFGRRPVIILAVLASKISSLSVLFVYYLRWPFYFFYAGSLLQSFVPTGVLFNIWAMDMTDEGDRTTFFGIIAAATILQSAVAPTVGEVVTDPATLLDFMVFLKLIAVLVAIFLLPESKGFSLRAGAGGVAPETTSDMSYWECCKRLVQDPTSRTVLILVLVSSAVTRGTADVSGQYNKNVFGMTSRLRATFTLIGVASGLFCNLVLLKLMKTRLSTKRQVLISMSAGMVSVFLNLVARSLGPLYVATALTGLTSLLGTFVNVLKVNVAQTSGMPAGAVVGLFESASELMALVGPPFCTAVFLASLKPIFWGQKFPQLIWAVALVMNACVFQLLYMIPAAAYDAWQPPPESSAALTSFPV